MWKLKITLWLPAIAIWLPAAPLRVAPQDEEPCIINNLRLMLRVKA